MKVGQKYVVKKPQVKHVATFCDICGEDCDLQVRKHVGNNYSAYDTTEVEIEAKVGCTWPDGDDERNVYEIDVCIVCFLEKVKPAIEALGGKFREREGDVYKTFYQKVHEIDCDMDEDCTCGAQE